MPRSKSLLNRLGHSGEFVLVTNHLHCSSTRISMFNHANYAEGYRDRKHLWDEVDTDSFGLQAYSVRSKLQDIVQLTESDLTDSLMSSEEVFRVLSSMLDKHSAQLPLNIESIAIYRVFVNESTESSTAPIELYKVCDTVFYRPGYNR